MKDENTSPKDIAIIVVKRYRDKVLIPSLDKDVSSDKDIIPQTIEKKIKGMIINFNAEINKLDTTLKTFIIIKLVNKLSWLKKFKTIPKNIPKTIAIMIFFVNDIIE